MLSRTPAFWQTRGVIAFALLPLAWLYQCGYFTRRLFAKPYRPTVPLVCIGNLVAGGAGKTPVALAVGEWLKAQGVNACFLTKAYGGSIVQPTRITPSHTVKETGDEALLLARLLPTIAAKNRKKGAEFAIKQGFSLIVMDDGFQNPTLDPHVSLIVIDAHYQFGNSFTLPAGPLRENVKYGLARASALVLAEREGRPASGDFPPPVIRLTLQTVVNADMAGKPLLAFCGIARPEPFFAALRRLGAEVKAEKTFPDHHPFTFAEMEALENNAKRLGATLITTAKDAVRLPPEKKTEVLVADLAVNWHNARDLETVLAPYMPMKEPLS